MAITATTPTRKLVDCPNNCGKRHYSDGGALHRCRTALLEATVESKPSQLRWARNGVEVPWTTCPDCLELADWCSNCLEGDEQADLVPLVVEEPVVVDDAPPVDRTTALYELELVRRIRTGELKRSELARFAGRSKSDLGRSNYFVKLAAGSISMELWRKAVVLRGEALAKRA